MILIQLPFHIQWQDLKDLFRQAGSILRADVALGPDNRSRGFGSVVFATDVDAERAVQMFNGLVYLRWFHFGSRCQIVINFAHMGGMCDTSTPELCGLAVSPQIYLCLSL